MRRAVAFSVLLAAVAVQGCQTRNAAPVRVSQAGDQALDCEQLRLMQVQNGKDAIRLAKLDEGVAIGNAIAVAINQLWFWPGIFGVDMSDAEEIEARALYDRNRRLDEIAKAKACPEPAAAPAPPPAANATAKAT